MEFKGRTIETSVRLLQGSILSHALFNVYLDALLSKITMKQYIKKERLEAFADDVIMHACEEKQMKRVLKALRNI